MIPESLKKCLKRVMCLRFDEDPPYDFILECLYESFCESLAQLQPGAPPSSVSGMSHRNYRFEWNRTLANRVRNNLIAEADVFSRAVNVRLNSQDSIIRSSYKREDLFHNILNNHSSSRSLSLGKRFELSVSREISPQHQASVNSLAEKIIVKRDPRSLSVPSVLLRRRS